ncbi:MAG TPA: hypothetical protein VKG43_12830 [Acidimicrobiales bacterium]|nr:hypothetical protein [Acidimicrobiales bacterium]
MTDSGGHDGGLAPPGADSTAAGPGDGRPLLRRVWSKRSLLSALLLLTAAVGFFIGYLQRPVDDSPPSVPAAPTFVLDLHVSSAMPSAWQVHTNLIEDEGQSWLVLSFGPQQNATATYSFDLLGWALPVDAHGCGLLKNPGYYDCFGESAARRMFPNEHGLLFPRPSQQGVFPPQGQIVAVTGAGDGGPVVLRFALDQGAESIARIGSFVSFSLAPVILNVTGPAGEPISSAVTFDTELGTPDLRTITLASGNAPSSTLRDPAVSSLDGNNFLTSWLWAESDPLNAGPGATASSQSTPVTVSAATNVAIAQSENHQAFVSGVWLGIAGGAFVGFLQEVLGGVNLHPIRRRRAAA